MMPSWKHNDTQRGASVRTPRRRLPTLVRLGPGALPKVLPPLAKPADSPASGVLNYGALVAQLLAELLASRTPCCGTYMSI
jgi:hypothetical protein